MQLLLNTLNNKKIIWTEPQKYGKVSLLYKIRITVCPDKTYQEDCQMASLFTEGCCSGFFICEKGAHFGIFIHDGQK